MNVIIYMDIGLFISGEIDIATDWCDSKNLLLSHCNNEFIINARYWPKRYASLSNNYSESHGDVSEDDYEHNFKGRDFAGTLTRGYHTRSSSGLISEMWSYIDMYLYV